MFVAAILFALLSFGTGVLAFGIAPTAYRSAVDAAFLACVACFLISTTGALAQRLHRSYRRDFDRIASRSGRARTGIGSPSDDKTTKQRQD